MMSTPSPSGSRSIADGASGSAPRPLAELLTRVTGAEPPAGAGDVSITGITASSQQVEPGNLFVAISGTARDGHDFIGDAVSRGASALVVEREVTGTGVPTVRVERSRQALAELAAAWHGHPADRLPLVGITGTLGKTSILKLLEAMAAGAGMRIGTIGSLGVQFDGRVLDTGHTVPDPLVIQEALARMVSGGAELVVMEVTSHALAQDRVHGLHYSFGIFTNLVPLEHMEYHGSFEAYVETKLRYFDHLRPRSPFVFSAGDRSLAAIAKERDVIPIGCGGGDDADVQIERRGMDAHRTRLVLKVRRALPQLDGGQVEPCAIPLELRLLGRSNTNNAGLAATAALCLGIPVEAIQSTLATFPPAPRRMEVIHRGRFMVVDDTVGHPDSVTAVFEVAEQLPHERLHVVVAIRGQRGEEINRRDAGAIAIWSERVPITTLAVTRSVDAADERNQVEPGERDAFVERLRDAGCEFEEHDRLHDAVEAVLQQAGEGDLVLLLGAQGMDAGSDIVHRWVEQNDPS